MEVVKYRKIIEIAKLEPFLKTVDWKLLTIGIAEEDFGSSVKKKKLERL